MSILLRRERSAFAAGASAQADTAAATKAACEHAMRHWEGSVDLAMMFVSPHHADRLGEAAAVIKEMVGPAVLMGCTAEGVITNDQELERQPAVTVWMARFPGITLTPFHLTFQQTAEGVGASGWPGPFPPDATPSVFLLLGEPYTTPGTELLAFLESRCPGALAIGGMASGGGAGGNRIVLNDSVVDEGVVGVALAGDARVATVVSQGCRPIGERFLITKADGNVIHELGGRPAFTCLQEVYAALPSHEQELARRGLHLGVTINEAKAQFDRGDFLVRNLMGADQKEGSLVITDIVREGQTVQFHLRDRETASEDLNYLLESEKNRVQGVQPAAALLFSCNGRGRRLFGRPHHDVTALKIHLGDLPISGFFAQGEIGPVGGENFLHGFTASVAIFYASPER